MLATNEAGCSPGAAALASSTTTIGGSTGSGCDTASASASVATKPAPASERQSASFCHQAMSAPLRAEAPDHVVYVDSLTKTVGGGLRLGWVAASGPVLERIARQKRLADTHSVTLTQLVGARFLASGDHERHLA